MRALASALTTMMVAMMPGGVRSSLGEAAVGVEHHGGEEEREIDDGGFEEVVGVLARGWSEGRTDDAGEADGVPEVGEAEHGRGDGVEVAGGVEGYGPEADGDHEDGVEEGLDDGAAGGVLRVGLGGGEADAGGGVVVAIHPADGHEVGELPDE